MFRLSGGERMNKKIIYWVGAILLVVALLWGSSVLMLNVVFGPTKVVRTAMQSDKDVKVTFQEKQTWLVFTPVSVPVKAGLIMYPENYQDIRMYAPISRLIASKGYQVVFLSRREKFPLTSAEEENRVANVMKAYPSVGKWFIGAHTWEAGIAAWVARQHQDTISGVVLWAGRLAPESNISDLKLPVLQIYGTLDEKNENLVAGNEGLLPPQTQVVWIEGGDRVNFGNFGPLPRDVAATIPMEEQQQQAADATVKFLEDSLK
jgi:hypothetical protein